MTGDINLEVGLLKKDVSTINLILTKLDTTLDKFQDLTASLARMLTSHDERINQAAIERKDIEVGLAKHIMEDQANFKELNTRVTIMAENFTARINSSEKNITDDIQSLREYLENKISEVEQTTEEENRTTIWGGTGVNSIWFYLITGGAVTMGWVISHVDLVALSKIFH